MQLVYVIKGFNSQHENKKWCVSEDMVGETGDSALVEEHMLRMAENLVEQLENQGWYITNKEVGMMHDDRRGYDVMGQFGKPLNLMMAVSKARCVWEQNKTLSRSEISFMLVKNNLDFTEGYY